MLDGISINEDGKYFIDRNLWLKHPIQNLKYLLVSWRLSGSEFARQLIRENFPETINIDLWGKSHMQIPPQMTSILKKTKIKIFFIIADPRDVATHITFHDNGIHKYGDDYSTYAYNNPLSIQFLNETADNVIKLYNFFNKNFKDNMIVLKYEDAVYHQEQFLNQVSNFINLKPLNIDDNNKYKCDVFKQIGVFELYYNENIFKKHYDNYSFFYKKWGYIVDGCQLRKNILKNKTLYIDFLNRNGIFSYEVPYNSNNGVFKNDLINNRISGINTI